MVSDSVVQWGTYFNAACRNVLACMRRHPAGVPADGQPQPPCVAAVLPAGRGAAAAAARCRRLARGRGRSQCHPPPAPAAQPAAGDVPARPRPHGPPAPRHGRHAAGAVSRSSLRRLKGACCGASSLCTAFALGSADEVGLVRVTYKPGAGRHHSCVNPTSYWSS